MSSPFATSSQVFLERLGWSAADIAILVDEYKEIQERLTRQYKSTTLALPLRFGVERETGFFLYAATRLTKPQKVVETGVADGRSSFIFLAALERNGGGLLHSFDINSKAGGLVRAHDQWHLKISDPTAPELSFIQSLLKLGKVDFFFHDSDHRYLGQLLEYDFVWPRMRAGGLFASDDVDVSKAFLDFCRRHAQRPEFLFDSRKITGALRI